MEKPEFDKFAEDYDSIMDESIPDKLNEGTYFSEYKIALVAKAMQHSNVQRILDYGCGAGRGLPYLKQYFPDAEIWGYDISPASLALAHQRMPDSLLFTNWSEAKMDYFDLIVSANVFHHIPHNERLNAFKQCHDALTAHGRFFLFEHNPYNPVTRWIFERCPFDNDAAMLNMAEAMRLCYSADLPPVSHGYTLFFPRPFALLRRLESYIRWLPIGAQYYIERKRVK